VLDANGFENVQVLSPTSDNSYEGMGECSGQFVRSGWRAVVAGDILQKLVLRHRAHELRRGDADAAYEESVQDLCRTIETSTTEPGPQLASMRRSMVRARDRFRAVRVQRDPGKPLIGVVGEIFCRLNTYSNDDLIRRLEEYGGEGWLSDIAEWVWYTVAEQFRKLRLAGRRWSVDMLKTHVRKLVQHHDEKVLFEPFREDFLGIEEPDIDEILEGARPYLPQEGAFGEMVLNVGKIVYLAKKGVDGIIDISPFTCMNGIVSEAIYPRLSRDLGGLPIRNFYFDGTQSDLDRDLGVYLELARAYKARKLAA
jgi:predicted nucleotide-binding protein (sugar kinase/HSP70/actin superfamily)